MENMKSDDKNGTLPLKLSMALSNNKGAFLTFLNMTDEEQDRVINAAREKNTVREINKIVEGLTNVTEM